MLIDAPPVSFTSILPEPAAAGYVYVFHRNADPRKIYVTQSIPRLAREVLVGLCGSAINISSLYRSVDQPSKQRQARSYTLISVDLDRLNGLLKLYGGAAFVVGQLDLWSFDLASVGV